MSDPEPPPEPVPELVPNFGIFFPNKKNLLDPAAPDIACHIWNKTITGSPSGQPNKKGRITVIALNNQKLRLNSPYGWSRFGLQGSGWINTRNGIAGATYTCNFPSKAAQCINTNWQGNPICNNTNPPNEIYGCNCIPDKSFGYNQLLLAKKNYMFRNKNTNVTSGPITNKGNINFISAVSLGGYSGQGLTRNQMLANAGKGFTPAGTKSTRFGIQTQTLSIPNIFDYQNNKNRQTVIVNNRPTFIERC